MHGQMDYGESPLDNHIEEMSQTAIESCGQCQKAIWITDNVVEDDSGTIYCSPYCFLISAEYDFPHGDSDHKTDAESEGGNLTNMTDIVIRDFTENE